MARKWFIIVPFFIIFLESCIANITTTETNRADDYQKIGSIEDFSISYNNENDTYDVSTSFTLLVFENGEEVPTYRINVHRYLSERDNIRNVEDMLKKSPSYSYGICDATIEDYIRNGGKLPDNCLQETNVIHILGLTPALDNNEKTYYFNMLVNILDFPTARLIVSQKHYDVKKITIPRYAYFNFSLLGKGSISAVGGKSKITNTIEGVNSFPIKLPEGINIALTASPDSGYEFSLWDNCDRVENTVCFFKTPKNYDVNYTFPRAVFVPLDINDKRPQMCKAYSTLDATQRDITQTLFSDKNPNSDAYINVGVYRFVDRNNLDAIYRIPYYNYDNLPELYVGNTFFPIIATTLYDDTKINEVYTITVSAVIYDEEQERNVLYEGSQSMDVVQCRTSADVIYYVYVLKQIPLEASAYVVEKL